MVVCYQFGDFKEWAIKGRGKKGWKYLFYCSERCMERNWEKLLANETDDWLKDLMIPHFQEILIEWKTDIANIAESKAGKQKSVNLLLDRDVNDNLNDSINDRPKNEEDTYNWTPLMLFGLVVAGFFLGYFFIRWIKEAAKSRRGNSPQKNQLQN